MSPTGALDFGYTFIKARDAAINSNQGTGATGIGLVNGTYKADVHLLGVQYRIRLLVVEKQRAQGPSGSARA